MSRTLGQHIASRLLEVGIDTLFAVPGDFNLVLLDQFLVGNGPKVRMINTCNELNAGYAADGYARARGAGCVIVTFTVGGLSVINAIAGAYSEDLPVICIVGGPNSNDFGTNRILHHTIGLPDFHQEMKAFSNVTCHQVQVTHLEDAHEQVDHAIAEALRQQKPVYISLACNICGIPWPTFDEVPVPFALAPKISNPRSLDAAATAAANFLNAKVKPVLVAGVKLRPCHAEQAFLDLADASEYPVAIQPNAKGFFPEQHERFIGTYWGNVSTAYCAEVVEAADAYLFAGPLFNDYTSVGYSLLIKKENLIQEVAMRLADQQVHRDVVCIGGKQVFQCIAMKDFLTELAKRVKKNSTAWENHQRMYLPPPEVPHSPPGTPLRTNVLYKHVQGMLTSDSAVIAETGDSWFNCQKLKLPDGCGYEFQMQYGSIGWAVGATLGYAVGVEGKKRVIASIGDGSFQVTAQDLSTMIRYEQNTIIFLINNGGYTIEVEIHDGPYNVIKNWDYVGLCRAFSNGDGKAVATRVTTEEELIAAIKEAHNNADKVVLIECVVHKDDCSKELLEWGSRVAAANSRPPHYDV